MFVPSIESLSLLFLCFILFNIRLLFTIVNYLGFLLAVNVQEKLQFDQLL
jgi:hypothetical protein